MVDTPKEVSKMVLTDPKRSYAEALFELHPTFIPTQALYLDLEGSGGGSEEILSVYWPFLPTDQRFSWLKRTATTEIDLLSINELVQRIGADRAKSVVVFSGGQPSPAEKDRVVDLLGEDPFPDSKWINLHYVLRQCRDIRASIREHRYVWHHTDRSRIRYSLEALEFEFDIVRPPSLRSHNNRYRDLNGQPGEMEVLAIAQRVKAGTAARDEECSLREYCEADVRSMWEITYRCERLLYSREARQSRRRLNS